MSSNDLEITIKRGVIIPSTASFPPENEDDDTIVSILCWINDPLAIVSLRGTRRVFLDAEPNFFRPTHNVGVMITCTGHVNFMLLQGFAVPTVNSHLCVGIQSLTILPGRVEVNAAFQQFLNVVEGPIIQTRSQNTGFTNINFRNRTSRFVADEDPQEDLNEEDLNAEDEEEWGEEPNMDDLNTDEDKSNEEDKPRWKGKGRQDPREDDHVEKGATSAELGTGLNVTFELPESKKRERDDNEEEEVPVNKMKELTINKRSTSVKKFKRRLIAKDEESGSESSRSNSPRTRLRMFNRDRSESTPSQRSESGGTQESGSDRDGAPEKRSSSRIRDIATSNEVRRSNRIRNIKK